MEDESLGAAAVLVDDTPDALLVLAARLQKALDACVVRSGVKKGSRVKKH
ncbi:hypothetical protein ABIE33_006817 [Ensifer sp. 4252]